MLRNPLAWLLLLVVVLGALVLLRKGGGRDAEPGPAATENPSRPAAIPDRDPQPIARIKPVYPPEALARGDQGYVTIHVDIDAAGAPARVFVSRSSGHDALDQAALAALREWRFHPAIRGGKPVPSSMEEPILFKPDAP
jgi:TonB family protein